MNNEFIVGVVNKLHGFHTRIKECHYGAPNYNTHKLTDDFVGELDEFEDALVENASALYGFIMPGDLNPELPENMEFDTILEDIRGLAISVKREFSENLMASGIVNLTDDFIQTVNKYIYLLKIVNQ